MTHHYAIVFEPDSNGTIYGYLPDIPGVYGVGKTFDEAADAVRESLDAYATLQAETGQPLAEARAAVRVARLTVTRRAAHTTLVGPAALIGSRRTAAKVAASRANGRRGGRPQQTSRSAK